MDFKVNTKIKLSTNTIKLSLKPFNSFDNVTKSNYLVHLTPNEKDAESIIKNGFKISDNPYIIEGVYTRWGGAHHYNKDLYLKNNMHGTLLKININPNARTLFVGNNSVNKNENIEFTGEGNVEFQKLWVKSVIQVNPKYTPLVNDIGKSIINRSDLYKEFVSEIYWNNVKTSDALRAKFMKYLTSDLKNKGVDIFLTQSGNLPIILNRDVITNVEIESTF